MADTDSPHLTDFGFTWGPAEITRLTYIPGRGRVLSIRTAHAEAQVLISEKGRRLRIWLGNEELAGSQR